MSITPGTKLGRYKIRSKIGEGGMGKVYLALDTKLDRKVALKILPVELAADKDRMLRFEQEAKATAALNHPNILTVYEIGEADGKNYISTELIDGPTLREHLAQKEELPLDTILVIGVQVAEALSAAHQTGIIHRDIKPENIMLRRDGIVKVLDFGLAKLTEPLPPESVDAEAPTRAAIKTEPGMVMGTASYMSPEQARGLEVDARTDIFSVGVLIYEMVAGRKPFDAPKSNEIIASILSDKEAPPLARYTNEAPAELQRIVSKALRKNRDQRYQTTKDFLLDLQNLKHDLEFARKSQSSVPPNSKSAATVLEHFPNGRATDSLVRPTVTAGGLTNAHRPNLGAAVLVAAMLIGTGAGLYLYFSRARQGPINSMAVLPFVNASGNADFEYLSDGMTETLINNLSQIPDLSVKARSTVFRYKGKGVTPQQVGSELSVQAVLNGHVTEQGDQLTLNLELADARTGDLIWGEQYIRKATDLIALQNQIARDVSSKLRTRLSNANKQKLAKNYTENTEAYKLYLQGVFYSNQLNSARAIEYLRQAIAIDPNYALAYSGLGDSYLFSLVAIGGQRTADADEVLPKARECAAKAIELDNDLPDAHALMGLLLLMQDRDFAGCEREIVRAIELNPNYAEGRRRNGLRLFYLGQFEAARSELRKALELDPLSNLYNYHYAQTLVYEGRYNEAEARIRKNLELDSRFQLFHSQLSTLYRLQGNYPGAVEESAKTSELQSQPASARLKRESFAKGGWQGYQQVLVTELEQNKSNPYALAIAYIELREKEKAFAALDEVFNAHSNFVGYFKIDPQLNPLRDDPRFAVLLKKSGFVQ